MKRKTRNRNAPKCGERGKKKNPLSPIPPLPKTKVMYSFGDQFVDKGKLIRADLAGANIYRNGYILHPPDAWMPLEYTQNVAPYITEENLPLADVVIPLKIKRMNFEEDKCKSLYAIEAFLIAHKAGIYPPLWVLDYFNQIFKGWYDLQGKIKLDEAFFSRRRGGKAPFKLSTIEERDELLFYKVFLLDTVFGFKIKDACEIVLYAFESKPEWNQSVFRDISMPSAKSASIIYKTWKRIFKKGYSDYISKMTTKDKKDFLENLPYKDLSAFRNKNNKNVEDIIRDLFLKR